MKINNIGLSKMNPYNRNANNVNRDGKKANKTTDKIEISTTAKEMQQMQNITNYATERQQKVADIKVQVESGTYKVDPDKIASSVYDYYFKK